MDSIKHGLARSGRKAVVALFLGIAGAASAQVTYTPMPLDQGFGPLDTSAPSVPAEQLITRFASKEAEFRQALENYTYHRTVRVQTVDDDGKVDGEYFEEADISFDSTGKRTEHVTFAPANSLERISMSPADFQDIQQRLPFVLTTEDIGQYDVTYAGKQKVDDLDTFVFDVKPKRIEKNKRYFQGKIWVDAQDYQIVVTNGKNVPDDTRKGHEDLSPPFTTYREQVDGKYWFPVYTKGEGVLHFQGGSGYMGNEVHIRETLKYSNYKQFKSTIKILYGGQDITNNGDAKGQGAPQPNPQGAPQGGGTPTPAPPANGPK